VVRRDALKEGNGGPQERQGQRGRPAIARPQSTWAARYGPNKGGTDVSDVWALVGSGRGRERRGTGRVGRPGKKRRVPSLDEQESF
jgi:hypothetical protein